MAATTFDSPSTMTQALGLLAASGGGVKILAGGQSLVPLMNTGLARPEGLVDLRRLDELRFVSVEGGLLRLGAMNRHVDLEESASLKEVCPLIPAAAGWIGHPQIRNRGTLGGSLVHADPAAEWPMVLTCLGARVRLIGTEGERWLPISEFIVGPYVTGLRDDELLVEVQAPLPPAGHGWSMQEVARRHGDFAMVAAAAVMTGDNSGAVRSVTLALCGSGFGPVNAEVAVADLVGSRPEPGAFARVAARVVDLVDPPSDNYVSATYKKRLAGILSQRALEEAASRMVVAPTKEG